MYHFLLSQMDSLSLDKCMYDIMIRMLEFYGTEILAVS